PLPRSHRLRPRPPEVRVLRGRPGDARQGAVPLPPATRRRHVFRLRRPADGRDPSRSSRRSHDRTHLALRLATLARHPPTRPRLTRNQQQRWLKDHLMGAGHVTAYHAEPPTPPTREARPPSTPLSVGSLRVAQRTHRIAG